MNMKTDKHRKQKSEQALQKALALQVAKGHCEQNNLSIDKLKEQLFYLVYSSAIFAQPSNVTPNGLLNDLETQPKPTLIIELADNCLKVLETEYTAKYLTA